MSSHREGSTCSKKIHTEEIECQRVDIGSVSYDIWVLIFPLATPFVNFLLSWTNKHIRECIQMCGSDEKMSCSLDRLLLNINTPRDKSIDVTQLLDNGYFFVYFGLNSSCRLDYKFVSGMNIDYKNHPRITVSDNIDNNKKLGSVITESFTIRFMDSLKDSRKLNPNESRILQAAAEKLIKPRRYALWGVEIISIGFELPGCYVPLTSLFDLDRLNPRIYRLTFICKLTYYIGDGGLDDRFTKLITDCLFNWKNDIMTGDVWKIIDNPSEFDKIIRPSLRIEDDKVKFEYAPEHVRFQVF